MSAVEIEPPPALSGEKYLEFLGGKWNKKGNAGLSAHEDVTQSLYNLLLPFQRKYGGRLRQHWTIILGGEKGEPDVVLSHPTFVEHKGYLLSGALLAVEVRSYGQTLDYLTDKCVDKYHKFGIPFCWIVDSDGGAYECHASNEKRQRVDILTAGANIALPISAIFEELARL